MSFLNTRSIHVAFSESYIDKLIDATFSAEPRLALEVKSFMARFEAKYDTDSKPYFIKQIDDMLYIYGLEYTLDHYRSVFPKPEQKTEINPVKQVVKIVDKTAFEKVYGENAEGVGDSSGVKIKIIDIFNRLLTNENFYLTADEKMLFEFDNLLKHHPNVENKEALSGYMKVAVMHSKGNIIHLPPLLFVGSPGCGKTMLAKEITKVF